MSSGVLRCDGVVTVAGDGAPPVFWCLDPGPGA